MARAPALPDGGARVGEATAAVTPWPHQVRAFERLYAHWPPRLLIADEVGLGKTIQAGLLLRQAWLAGRAKRILILAPKAVLRQWQIELREKFNLNWPIYDGRQLVWYAVARPRRGRRSRRPVDPGCVARRAGPHRVQPPDAAPVTGRKCSSMKRRRGTWWCSTKPITPGGVRRDRRRKGGPNALLRLMRGLKDRAAGLLLLTATPMQVHVRHPQEVIIMTNWS